MNWSQLKRILIISLLLTNLVIAYFLFQKNENNIKYNESQRLVMINSILEEKDIINRIELAPDVETMPKLNLEYQTYDLKAIADKFFTTGYKSEGGEYIGDDYSIRLVDNGTIFYLKSNKSRHKSPPLPLDSHKKITESFMAKLGFAKDYYFFDKEQGEYSLKLQYLQKYEDYFINNSYMTVTIGSGIETIERRWAVVNKGENESEKLNIIAYSDALFKAVDIIEQKNYPRPLVIDNVVLAYGLNNSVFGQDILSGEALPYYQFFLENGEIISIPALKVE